MKIKNTLMVSLILLGLISAGNINTIHASSYPHGIQYQKDPDGKYDPVSNNGKGPALDIGNGKYGQLDKAQAEAWNSGNPNGTRNSSPKHVIYYHHGSYTSSKTNNNDYSPSFKLPHLRTKHEIIKHKRNVIKHKRLAAQHAKSLRIIHTGLIWTGVVLVGALLIYYFVSKRKPRRVIKKP